MDWRDIGRTVRWESSPAPAIEARRQGRSSESSQLSSGLRQPGSSFLALCSGRLPALCSSRSAHFCRFCFQASSSQPANKHPARIATMSEAAAADADTTKVNLVSFVFCHGQFCFRGRGFPSAGAIIIIRRDSARARPTQIHGNRKRRGGGSFAFGFSVPAFVSPARYSGRSSFQWVSHREFGHFSRPVLPFGGTNFPINRSGLCPGFIFALHLFEICSGRILRPGRRSPWNSVPRPNW